MEEKNLSKAHISKSVDNLRAKGFVVLTEDENDRRKRHIELTEKAVEAAKNMLEVHNPDYSVNHCVRWGGQAAEQLLEKRNMKIITKDL